MINYERENEISTDEIIKRLERCVKRGNRNYNTDIVLDLINCQKAEIERLNKKVEELSDVLSDTIKIQYAEAYKEFAERLKEKWSNNYYDSPDVDFDEFVDNLLKEMLGEE
ncbi:hypothetical protein [Eubacterium sp.]